MPSVRHPRAQGLGFDRPHGAAPGDIVQHVTGGLFRVTQVHTPTFCVGVELRWWERLLPGAMRSRRRHRIRMHAGHTPRVGDLIEPREGGPLLRVVQLIGDREVIARAPRWFDPLAVLAMRVARRARKSGR